MEIPQTRKCSITTPRHGEGEWAKTILEVTLYNPNQHGVIEVAIKRQFNSSGHSYIQFSREGETYRRTTPNVSGPIDKSQLKELEDYLTAVDPADAELIREAFGMEKVQEEKLPGVAKVKDVTKDNLKGATE